uniref:LapA family protein n=1 Tax=Dictyoglomus turgidum TaxID=513050 RepID=A0A7C3WMX7_9BACT
MSNLIIVLLLGIIIALIFSFQNQTDVVIYFINWSFTTKISTVLFITFAIGVLLAFISVLPVLFKYKREISKLYRKIKDYEKQFKVSQEQEKSTGN